MVPYGSLFLTILVSGINVDSRSKMFCIVQTLPELDDCKVNIDNNVATFEKSWRLQMEILILEAKAQAM